MASKKKIPVVAEAEAEIENNTNSILESNNDETEPQEPTQEEVAKAVAEMTATTGDSSLKIGESMKSIMGNIAGSEPCLICGKEISKAYAYITVSGKRKPICSAGCLKKRAKRWAATRG